MNDTVKTSASSESEVIPPRLAIEAMRDSGYKNTAYALAELIDNAVQAGASQVEVFCVETWERISERQRRRLHKIAVLDNGSGMDAQTLRLALQFGNGTRLNDRSGIGRFGMGLPNASIAQCRRLDVWTWMAGPANALWTYLDVDEIARGGLRDVPEPSMDPLPWEWQELSEEVGQSGTLVVWTELDEKRLTWKGGNATLKHTEELAGRMYRKFIHDDSLTLRLVRVTDREIQSDTEAKVNDPLYLMSPSVTPKPFDDKPMFQPHGDPAHIPITVDSEKHYVTVSASYAKPETYPKDSDNRGHTPYGKHAAKNVGISIVRAGRELDLDDAWTNKYDPTERWWSIEVEFPPALDEIFGVPNNKQAASRFTGMAQFDWQTEAEEGESEFEVKERLEEEGDPRHHLMELVRHIHGRIKQLRSEVDRQGANKRSGRKRHDEPSVEDKITGKINERAMEGNTTPYDDEDFNKQELLESLTEKNRVPNRDAREIADAVEQWGRKIIFVEAEADTPAFFQVDHAGGVTEIVINRRHPAYETLVAVLDPDPSTKNGDELLQRLNTASETLRILLAAWARYEEEDTKNQERLRDTRYEWGKMARAFLSEEG